MQTRSNHTLFSLQTAADSKRCRALLLLQSTRAHWLKHNIHTASLQHELDFANHEQRAKMKAFFNQPLFVPQYNISVDEERKLALKRLQAVCSQGFFSVKDFKTNPDKIFAAHELSGLVDGAMATKMTVQFNLFGGTVLKLGTARHHGAFLDQIDRVDQIGCFGLTELGYGNNAVEMETTATYDEKTKEWVINSPSTLSQKYWSVEAARKQQGNTAECMQSREAVDRSVFWRTGEKQEPTGASTLRREGQRSD